MCVIVPRLFSLTIVATRLFRYFIIFLLLITMSSGSDNSKHYQPDIESVEEFLQRFQLQNYDALHKTRKDPTRSAMLLANALPVPVLTDVQRKLQPRKLTEVSFDDIQEQLLASYSVKKSFVAASVSFHTRKQKECETIEEYSKVLNQLASECEYKDCCRDKLLRNVFISGLNSSKLIKALICDSEDKTFIECVQKAKVLQQITVDVENITPGASASANYKLHSAITAPKSTAGSKKVPANYTCIRCGAEGKHFASDCFALERTCFTCSKKGHISKVCRSKHTKITPSSNYINPEEQDAAEYVTMHQVPEVREATDIRTHNRFLQLRDECANENDVEENDDYYMANSTDSTVLKKTKKPNPFLE